MLPLIFQKAISSFHNNQNVQENTQMEFGNWKSKNKKSTFHALFLKDKKKTLKIKTLFCLAVQKSFKKTS